VLRAISEQAQPEGTEISGTAHPSDGQSGTGAKTDAQMIPLRLVLDTNVVYSQPWNRTGYNAAFLLVAIT
jgi:hypothetical protein